MGKYNAHERALIRRLEEQNELLTEQLKEQKDANLKLEDIKDILVMMLDKRQSPADTKITTGRLSDSFWVVMVSWCNLSHIWRGRTG